MKTGSFKKYFTLDEAVDKLPDVIFDVRQAQEELTGIQDSLTLTHRILLSRQDSGKEPTQAEQDLLQEKAAQLEAACNRWVQSFAEQGVIFRDFQTGLLDFPYHSKSRDEDYFLCWRSGEDGIFYFHSIREGFSGRHPISLLPE